MTKTESFFLGIIALGIIMAMLLGLVGVVHWWIT